MKRGLTQDQAERGEQPPPLTAAEWRALHTSSLLVELEAVDRTRLERLTRQNRRAA